MREGEKGLVPETIQRAIRGDVEIPQLEDFVAHFFQVAGGTRRVARMAYQEYRKAKPGSIIRQRILDLILRTTKFVSERRGASQELGILQELDLDREAQNIIREMRRAEEDPPVT